MALRVHALVTAVVAAVFARSLSHPLQVSWDDGRFILDNPLVREPSLAHLRQIFAGPQLQAYHPLHLLSYCIDGPWTDASATALHVTNLLLWAVAANLLLAAGRALGLSWLAAAISASLVALHPIQVEVVCWATGRKDVLAMLFAAAALLAHARAKGPWDSAAWLSRAMFLLGALSKTTILPLAGLLIIVDLAFGRRPFKAAVLQQLPALAIAVGLAPLVLQVWSENQMIRATAGGLVQAPTRAIASIGHQLSVAFWPSSNAPMYDTRAISHPDWWDYGLCIACLGLAMWRAPFGKAKSARGPAFLAAAGFITMMTPVANLIPMYFPLQDRYLSLPLLPLALAIGATGQQLADRGRGRLAAIGATALVAALAFRSAQYAGEWGSERALWGHAAATQPQAFYAWMKLGEVRRNADDLEGAIDAYAQLRRVDPTRKLGYAALLHAVALRDERTYRLSPSRAETYAQQFYTRIDNAPALRELAGQMLLSGHMRALELPVGWAHSIEPIPDAALEQAALSQFAAGRPSLGLFYFERLYTKPTRPDLATMAEEARKKVTPLPLFD